MSPEARQRFGPYRVTGVLGEGGMGTVFRAVRDDGAYDRDVAVKAIREDALHGPHALERFRQERRELAALDHPGIARLLDGGESPVPYLAMELVEGTPFTQYCRGRAVNQRLRLFVRVCEAVQYLHENLVVHRGLKPGNILVTSQGEPKLIDFGIAKLLPPEGVTPDYASPEQIRGANITTATDVYALGVILYEVLASARPHQFPSLSPLDIERTICEADPLPPSDIAPDEDIATVRGDLDNIALMAMGRDPARRYPSVEALAQDVRRYLEHRPISARPDTPLYRTTMYAKRHRFGVGAGAAVLALLAGGIAFAVHEGRVANGNFRETRQLATRVLFEFDESIRDTPGNTKSRELVARTALDYLDRLRERSGNDLELVSEVAAAYSKVADVQGSPGQPSLGRTQEALSSYGRSVVLWKQVIDLRPTDANAMRSLATTLYKAGDILLGAGEKEKAATSFQEGLAAATKAVELRPSDPELVYFAADGWYRQGDERRVAGDAKGAIAAYERGVDLYRRALAAQNSDQYRNAVAMSLGRIALARIDMYQPGAALDSAFQALSIRKDLAARNPSSIAFRRELVSQLGITASVYCSFQAVSLGDCRAAEHYLRDALLSLEAIADGDPDAAVREDQLLASARLCEVLAELRGYGATKICRKAAERGAELASAQSRSDVRMWVGMAWAGLARAELTAGSPSAALGASQTAAAILRDPKLRSGQPHAHLARAEVVAAEVALLRGERSNARAAYGRALEAAADPTVGRIPALAQVYRGLANMEWDPATRCDYQRREGALWDRWKREGAPAEQIPKLPAGCEGATS